MDNEKILDDNALKTRLDHIKPMELSIGTRWDEPLISMEQMNHYFNPDPPKVTAHYDPRTHTAVIQTPYGKTSVDPGLLTTATGNMHMSDVLDSIARRINAQQEDQMLQQVSCLLQRYAEYHMVIAPDAALLRRLVHREEPMYVSGVSGDRGYCSVCGTVLFRQTADGHPTNCCSYCGQTLMWGDSMDDRNRMLMEYNDAIERMAGDSGNVF